MRALTWAFCWAVVREALGHEPSVDEVAEWWGESRRTAFREQVAFRKAFPAHKTPAVMYDTEQAQRHIKALLRRFKNLEGIKAASEEELDAFALEMGLSPAA